MKLVFIHKQNLYVCKVTPFCLFILHRSRNKVNGILISGLVLWYFTPLSTIFDLLNLQKFFTQIPHILMCVNVLQCTNRIKSWIFTNNYNLYIKRICCSVPIPFYNVYTFVCPNLITLRIMIQIHIRVNYVLFAKQRSSFSRHFRRHNISIDDVKQLK
jgi:hypothetical protein